MATATITSKGQVTIPKEIRDRHNLEAGRKIEFLEDANGVISIWPLTTNVTKLKGLVRKPAKPVSLEEMKEAVRKGRAGLNDRH